MMMKQMMMIMKKNKMNKIKTRIQNQIHLKLNQNMNNYKNKQNYNKQCNYHLIHQVLYISYNIFQMNKK